MPEVVEIRKYADFLSDKFKNKKINAIKILKGRYKTHEPFELYQELTNKLPLKVLDVKTKGKFLYMVLEDDYYIFSTLGLHGGWVWLNNKNENEKINNEFIKENVNKFQFDKMLDYVTEDRLNGYYKTALNNLNVQFITDNGFMFYFDSLSFGTLKVIKGEDQLSKKLNSIGPDIMDESTTLDIYKLKMKKNTIQNKPIGNVLLNQKIISGIGNYLRADVLWMCKISPFRKVKDLTDKDLENIHSNIRALTWGDYDYKQAKKLKIIKKGIKIPKDYNRDFFVYYNDEDINGNKVTKEELYEGSQKRFIYWVKEVQQ
jgi:formamidopyrimidine-DNA glycosylase